MHAGSRIDAIWPPAVFGAVADLLEAPGREVAAAGEAEPALALLAALQAADAAPNERADLARLLRVAASFERAFTLVSGDAPGLAVAGGELRPPFGARSAGVSGVGLTLREALLACIGEGVEFLSQFATVGEEGAILPLATALAGAPAGMVTLLGQIAGNEIDLEAAPLSWSRGRRLANGAPVWVPTDLCLRRPQAQCQLSIPWPLSTGCGAGASFAEACRHGLLELVERDAVARWWQGALPARLLAAGSAGSVAVESTLAHLRPGGTQRTTWVLDLTSGFSVPVAAAVACNADGFGACFGFAADCTLAGAVRGALLELCQMELAHAVVMAKRAERGEAAWNAVDRRHARRYAELDTRRCPVLRAHPPAGTGCDVPAGDADGELAELVRRLTAHGLDPCVVDLTRPEFGVAVARVICAGLRPHPDWPPYASRDDESYCHRDVPLL